MQVGSKAVTGVADPADELALRHLLPGLHIESLAMGVPRPVAAVVLDNDIIAVPVIPVGGRSPACLLDDAAVGRDDGLAVDPALGNVNALVEFTASRSKGGIDVFKVRAPAR